MFVANCAKAFSADAIGSNNTVQEASLSWQEPILMATIFVYKLFVRCVSAAVAAAVVVVVCACVKS